MIVQIEEDYCLIRVEKKDNPVKLFDALPDFIANEEAAIQLIALDLTEIDKANSEIVASIVIAKNRLNQQNISVEIIAPETFRRAFDTVLLDKIIKIHYNKH